MRLVIASLIGLAACSTTEDTDTDPVDTTDTTPAGEPMEDGNFFLAFTLPDPLEVGDCEMVMTITNADGAAVSGAALQVTPTMPSMGHGTPDGSTVTELGGGEYSATWEWSMRGEWEILVEVGAQGMSDQVAWMVDVE